MRYIGRKEAKVQYEKRKAVYGIIMDQDRKLAIVNIHDGKMFNLIGGKVEEHEDKIEALKREAKEEIGYSLKEIHFYDNVTAYYYLDTKGIYTEAHTTFYLAMLDQKVSEPTEKTHQLVWLDPIKDLDILYFDYQKFIVRKYIKENESVAM